MPRTLCARVPEGVPAEDAAYATVAAIALHGVRLPRPGSGDVAAVIGLGLVGQLTLELLAAAGCVALGVDPDPAPRRARPRGRRSSPRPTPRSSRPRPLAARTGRGADARARHARPASTSAPLATATAVARERATVCVVGDVADRVAARAAVRQGAAPRGLALVRARPLRPDLRGAAASTTRPATCAGPRAATSRRCCG